MKSKNIQLNCAAVLKSQKGLKFRKWTSDMMEKQLAWIVSFFRKDRWIGVEWLGTFFSYLFVYFSPYIDSHSNSYAWNSFYGDVIFKPEENWNIIHFCPKRQRIGTFVFLDTWAQCSRNHFLRTILYFLHLFIIFQGTTSVCFDVTN